MPHPLSFTNTLTDTVVLNGLGDECLFQMPRARVALGRREHTTWVKNPLQISPPKQIHPTRTSPTPPAVASLGPTMF